MPEDVLQCLLCANRKSKFFDQREFRGLPVTNRVCAACGLVFQSPRMTEAELGNFYSNEYRRMYQGEEGPSAKDIAVQRLRAGNLLHFVMDCLGKPERHLDIGCSSGALLSCFQSALGCQPVGIEPGDAYRIYARDQGLTVYSSLEELKAYGDVGFDLVSLVHVLEHLPDPVSYLVKIRQTVLASDGWLLLEVPNLYAHDCFEVAHLASFSAHTLTQTLNKAGYGVIALKLHGQPRSLRIPLYISMLAKPERLTNVQTVFHVRAEKGVAIKRTLGMYRRRLVTRLFPRQAWLSFE